MKWLFVLALALALTGCQHVHPWERGKLAHPSMTAPLTTTAEEHMRGTQEGAAGGSATAESGCGCN